MQKNLQSISQQAPGRLRAVGSGGAQSEDKYDKLCSEIELKTNYFRAQWCEYQGDRWRNRKIERDHWADLFQGFAGFGQRIENPVRR